MIIIIKAAESTQHAALSAKHLARINSLAIRTSKDFYGYDSEKINLWKYQYGKCCYCEQKISYPYNDIEHYRPKQEAVRDPGCQKTHGYWWLAYDWRNLFYACASCNRSSKNSLFPLSLGSKTLEENCSPPGEEKPLLIDPASNDAVDNVNFEFIKIEKFPDLSWWKAVPINNSEIGSQTISTIGLNSQDRVEVRMNYYKDTLKPLVRRLLEAIRLQNIEAQNIYLECFRELFFANQPFSLFSFCVFENEFPTGISMMAARGIIFNRQMLGCTLSIYYGASLK